MNVRLLVTALGEAGHFVDLLVFPTGRDIELTNVRIKRIPNIFGVSHIPIGPSKIKLVMNMLMTGVVLWLCLIRKYDVIHGVEEGGFIAVAFARIFRKASVLDMDSCISEQLAYSEFLKKSFFLKLISNLEIWAVRHSSMVLTVCSALTEKVRSISADANIVQIEDIPLPDIWDFDSQAVEKIVDEYGLRNSYRIVYTGNLEKYQGIDLLLSAWEVFNAHKERGRSFKLIIVGGANKQVEYYKSVADSKGLTGTICWAGRRSGNEMGAWMALSDILVSPRTDGDNTPLKIFSYMFACRPIVATRRKAHTQVLDDSSAYLSEATPEKFAGSLIEAVNGGEESEKKVRSARKIVETKYSYEIFSTKLLDAYDSIYQTL